MLDDASDVASYDVSDVASDGVSDVVSDDVSDVVSDGSSGIARALAAFSIGFGSGFAWEIGCGKC